MLSPHHLEAFFACALESSTKTRHFDREWQELYRFIRHVQLAWEKGQILFGSDLMHVPTNREEMEYLSLIDFAKDCFATCAAYREYPHNCTLEAWVISRYLLARQEHFLVDDEPCSKGGQLFCSLLGPTQPLHFLRKSHRRSWQRIGERRSLIEQQLWKAATTMAGNL